MAAMSRRRLTPIVLHYPPHHGRPPTLSATDNPANTAAWGLACRQKGPARATKYFSGNGVAVASMCAVLHQYRPVAANEGGLTGKVDISLEMPPLGDYTETWSPWEAMDRKPRKLISACGASLYFSGRYWIRTSDLLLVRQAL